ncbi:MAG: LA_2272 family surface repeat-containing protein [Gemmatimonadales bacterium]
MKRHVSLLGIAVLAVGLTGTVQAQRRPIQIALVNPMQIFPETDSIAGLRINLLFGENAAMTGLDWGLTHRTHGLFKGVQFGIVGYNDTDAMGWQSNFINVTKRKFEGFQDGLVNYVEDGGGFQFGVVNRSKTMKGLQIGLVNYAERMAGGGGLQIGLVNIIRYGGVLPVMPIVNWSF